MPASRVPTKFDGEVPARQPGSGKAKVPLGAMLIPSRAVNSSLCNAW